jgi:hypothetical protein
MAINLLWWTPHLVITKSMKSKKKERRKLIGCFLLCMGQNYFGSMFSFFPCLRPIFHTHNIYIYTHNKRKEKKKKLRWGWSGQTTQCPFCSSFYFV